MCLQRTFIEAESVKDSNTNEILSKTLQCQFVKKGHLQPLGEKSECWGRVKPGFHFQLYNWKENDFLKDAWWKTHLPCLGIDLKHTPHTQDCVCTLSALSVSSVCATTVLVYRVVWEGLCNSASCLILWCFFFVYEYVCIHRHMHIFFISKLQVVSWDSLYIISLPLFCPVVLHFT